MSSLSYKIALPSFFYIWKRVENVYINTHARQEDGVNTVPLDNAFLSRRFFSLDANRIRSLLFLYD